LGLFFGKVVFMACLPMINNHRGFHAVMSMHAKAAFTAAHMSERLCRFGVLASMRHAIGCIAKAQFGCLPVGSLRAIAQRQSATFHRHAVACPAAVNGRHAPRKVCAEHQQIGLPSFGGQQIEKAVSKLVCVRQNPSKSKQGKRGMQRPNINVHRQVCVFSSPSTSRHSLTLRSSRRQQLSAVGALRAAHCGAAYL
jgi:hypothetical protein